MASMRMVCSGPSISMHLMFMLVLLWFVAGGV
jgi:hypothetical protein